MSMKVGFRILIHNEFTTYRFRRGRDANKGRQGWRSTFEGFGLHTCGRNGPPKQRSQRSGRHGRCEKAGRVYAMITTVLQCCAAPGKPRTEKESRGRTEERRLIFIPSLVSHTTSSFDNPDLSCTSSQPCRHPEVVTVQYVRSNECCYYSSLLYPSLRPCLLRPRSRCWSCRSENP
jgi:hypothetical protein